MTPRCQYTHTVTLFVLSATQPVTCKIRILKTKEETLALARQLEATGGAIKD
jgi:tRNA-dihydrouridine synthase